MIGRMDKRIVISNPTVTVSASGGTTTAFTTAATVWAKAEQRGESYRGNEKVSNKEGYRFTIWYDSGYTLNTKSRITYDSKDYGIVSIEKIGEKNEFILIDAISSI